jgi:membrane protein
MNPGTAFSLLKETFKDWNEDKASRLAAALAYYAAFAIAPLLLIAISIAGLVFGEEAARGAISTQLQGLLGADAAATVETAIENSSDPGLGSLSAIIGLALLIWSASNLFAQLQEALNTIWEVQPKPGQGILATLKKRFLSMTMVLGIGFLLLVSLVLSAALSIVGNFFSGVLPGGEALWQVVNFVVSFAVITLLFAAIYKVLPDVEIQWRDVWIGAAVTAFLFTVGRFLIGLYMGYSSVGSTFGAAGSLLVLLVWIYYAAQILFFGAEFTQVYARRFGSRIVPDADAVQLETEDRVKQGIPRKEHVERAAQTGQRVVPVSAVESADDAPRRAAAPAGQAGTNGQAAPQPHPLVRATAATPNGNGTYAGDPGTLKKVLWLGLTSGSMAVAGLLARRTTAAVWQTMMREPPPSSKV